MTEATPEMRAMARRIAEARVPDRSFTTHSMVLAMRELAYDAALAAIIEATEKCAELAEDRYVETDWFEPGKCIAATIRTGKQYGKE